MKPKVIVKPQRRDTRVLSEAVRRAAEARAVRAPLIVTGISNGMLRNITPDRFHQLDVDPNYQRGETSMVDEIVRALQAGGTVLDPVTLCRRPWDGKQDKLWIVDGHQRVCAFQQLGMPFMAVVHDSQSLDAEKKFFLALNSRRAISADVIVRSWTGPSASKLLKAEHDQSHPLFGRVKTSQGSSTARIGATMLARGMLAACTGLDPVGSAQRVLGRLDTAMKEPARVEMVERYLTLVGEVFHTQPQNAKGIVVVALGLVCWERWSQGADYPVKETILQLRAINWENEFPAWVKKFEPKAKEIMRRVWK